MEWYDSDDAVALTLTELDGITISDAAAWEFDIDARLISLAKGSYYWKLKTTDADGIVKIRLQGIIYVTLFLLPFHTPRTSRKSPSLTRKAAM